MTRPPAVTKLAEPLARDPALLGKAIRLANSPRYRTLRAISSVQEAVLLLGQRGLELLLVRVVMGPVFDGRQGRYSRAAGTLVWDLLLASAATTEAGKLHCRAISSDSRPVASSSASWKARLSGAFPPPRWRSTAAAGSPGRDAQRGSRRASEHVLARALRAADRASKRLLLVAAGDHGAAAGCEDEAAFERELRRVFGA